VFTTEVGGLLRQDNTRGHFRNVLKAANLPWMRIYDLRHSNASLLLAAGEDLKVVSQRLGHSTLALTADLYTHVSRWTQERAAGRFDELAVRAGSGSGLAEPWTH
jgi:integrase